MKERIAVGMSGGVDSSVAAALLKEQGFEVIGLFMRLGVGQGQGAERRCCSLEDGRDAERVARKIGIPLYDLDYRATFQKVIDDFMQGYHRGETPNPCVICNRDIKFDALWQQARQFGCTKIATGHYARILENEEGSFLARGRDALKDQSYFLFPIPRERLPHILFPLGDRNKKEVRQLAEKFDLPTKKKSESQDICFVGHETYGDFLRRKSPDKFREGKIFDSEGNYLGQHPGHQLFTLGQRRGHGIAAEQPLYVIGKNPLENSIILGKREALLCRKIQVRIFQWHHVPETGEIVDLMIRYNAPPLKARVMEMIPEKAIAIFEFLEKQEKTSPGQAAVAYHDDQMLGGGWILSFE
jgi:tRNA-specific 2-thiouridylase